MVDIFDVFDFFFENKFIDDIIIERRFNCIFLVLVIFWKYLFD